MCQDYPGSDDLFGEVACFSAHDLSAWHKTSEPANPTSPTTPAASVRLGSRRHRQLVEPEPTPGRVVSLALHLYNAGGLRTAWRASG